MRPYKLQSDYDRELQEAGGIFTDERVFRLLKDDPASQNMLREGLDMCQKGLDTCRENDRQLKNLIKILEDKVRTMAGKDFETMLKSREGAVQFLSHSTGEVRRAALYVLCDKWGLKQDLPLICETMAMEDPDPLVRCEAIGCLGALCYRSSNDPRLGSVLASIVSNTAEPTRVRKAAYRALFNVRGIAIQSIPTVQIDRFSESVDWEFVSTFMK
jgi:hypothetical protein